MWHSTPLHTDAGDWSSPPNPQHKHGANNAACRQSPNTRHPTTHHGTKLERWTWLPSPASIDNAPHIRDQNKIRPPQQTSLITLPSYHTRPSTTSAKLNQQNQNVEPTPNAIDITTASGNPPVTQLRMCMPASNKSALLLSNHKKAATIRKLAHGFTLPWLQSEALHFVWLTFGVF